MSISEFKKLKDVVDLKLMMKEIKLHMIILL